jgi:hypothetical protein
MDYLPIFKEWKWKELLPYQLHFWIQQKQSQRTSYFDSNLKKRKLEITKYGKANLTN